MALEDIYKGEDKTLTLTVTNKNTGNAIDLSGVNGIVCVLFYKNGTYLAKYSTNSLSGYNSDDIEVTDAANGVFKIYLKRAVTQDADPGAVFVEAKIEQVDSNFVSSEFHSIDSDKTIFELKEAQENDTDTSP